MDQVTRRVCTDTQAYLRTETSTRCEPCASSFPTQTRCCSCFASTVLDWNEPARVLRDLQDARAARLGALSGRRRACASASSS